MAATISLADRLRTDGFAIVEDVIDPSELDALITAFESGRGGSAIQRSGAVYGERNVLDAAGVVREACQSRPIRNLVQEVLGSKCFAVRGLFFDKVPGANWNLGWHQDLTIAVREKRDVPGFGPWSVKAGVTHVHGPTEVLRQIIAARIHLDDCAADNGALEVIPGTHRLGKIPAAEATRLSERKSVVCAASRGSVLLISPLLIHASRPSLRPVHRRVLHFEYANCDLPGGLEWHWKIGGNEPSRE